MTHAALLRHFSGKEELLLTALAQREAHDEEQADRILAAGTYGAAVMEGLRIQALLGPSHDPLRLMEPFMRMVITPAESQ